MQFFLQRFSHSKEGKLTDGFRYGSSLALLKIIIAFLCYTVNRKLRKQEGRNFKQLTLYTLYSGNSSYSITNLSTVSLLFQSFHFCSFFVLLKLTLPHMMPLYLGLLACVSLICHQYLLLIFSSDIPTITLKSSSLAIGIQTCGKKIGMSLGS